MAEKEGTEEKSNLLKKRKTKTTKDGTYVSLKLSTPLFNQLKHSTETLKMTQTDIMEAALKLYFKEYDSLAFVDEFEKSLITDKDSIMVPKALYARLNGLTLFELENFIKQNKIKVVSLSTDTTDKEKKTSYMVINFNDQKTAIGMILSLQQNLEKTRVDVIHCKQKITGLENTINRMRNNKSKEE